MCTWAKLKEKKGMIITIHENADVAKLRKSGSKKRKENIFIWNEKKNAVLRGWTRTEGSKYLCTNPLIYTHDDTFSRPLEMNSQSEGNESISKFSFFACFSFSQNKILIKQLYASETKTSKFIKNV